MALPPNLPTDADQQNQILVELNLAQDPVARALLCVSVWSLYAPQATVAPRLRYLYAKRSLIDYLMGLRRDAIDWSEAQASEKDSQQFTNLETLRKDVSDEIVLVEMRANAAKGGAIGQITATEIYPPAYGFPALAVPDPGNSMYRGDPRKRGSY